MKSLLVAFRILAIVFLTAVGHVAVAQAPGTSAQENSRPDFEGEYKGQLLAEEGEAVDVGLAVTAAGDNEYRAVLYYGGLPRDRSGPTADGDTVELEGTYEDFTLRLVGEVPFRLQYIHGRFTALDEENSYRGHLDRVVRVHPDS